MCDEHTADDNEHYLAAMSRRQFGVMTGAAGLAMLLPVPADAKPISGRDVSIKTPDGQADAYFVAPATGTHPGVLVWPDIMGLRPAFRQMADRLAQSGYAVLVVNQFYRSTKAPFLGPGESYDQPAVRARIAPFRDALTPEGTVRDAKSFTAFLDAQPQVDRKRGLATTGYCMGGPMVIRTAAAVSGRIRAGATFHGGGFVTDTPDSPHRLIPALKGSYLIAIAANDDARAPTEKDVLRAAFVTAKRPAEIEVYPETMHGWCPPDSKVYNPVQADRAWGRMLALFATALA
ncbi:MULTISPECIES: dienelactone hydrolase family protein [unclassified Sphingomonas]|jgi:carboxymethylenebutenolidase|uniref:dienelactone hydrolase family protein n=1 Tax=unclassified Sphingomonas TaxID=196159 RepID=UPI0006F9242A|nr:MULTISPECIES: dienelactone hydrolase family protein [unclassified Sphingomonas]KQN14370.1 dienelactone hydrolase [Sphingomonas sp. Leaf30]MBD8552352.1 dienelactone hydrolase family protein [Sphingomonas sp. CFBP 8764]